MPCETCGSYDDECRCVRRREILDDLKARAMRTERIDYMQDVWRIAYNEAARQYAYRTRGYDS